MNRALVVAVGVTALAGATLSRPAPTFAATQNTVVVYADSLGTEARPVLMRKLQDATPGTRVMIRATPGVAICDWLPTMVADQRLHPRLVVLAFFGNYGTPCMAHRDYTRAWKSDDRAASTCGWLEGHGC